MHLEVRLLLIILRTLETNFIYYYSNHKGDALRESAQCNWDIKKQKVLRIESMFNNIQHIIVVR